MKRVRCLAAACLLASVAAPALATPSATELRRRYEDATDAAVAGDYGRARELLLTLWQTQKTYDVAMSLAGVESSLGNHAAAAEFARHALAAFPPAEDPRTRARVEELYHQARQRVATVEVRAPQGVQIRVDDEAVGVAPIPEVFLMPGTHRFQIMQGERSGRAEIVAGAGESHVLTISLDAAPAEPARVPPVGAQPSRRSTWPVWVGVGVTFVTTASGGGFLAQAKSKADDADRLQDDIPGTDGCARAAPPIAACAELRGLRQDSDRAQNAATWLFAGSGVAALATISYLAWPRAQGSAFHVTPSGNGLTISGVF